MSFQQHKICFPKKSKVKITLKKLCFFIKLWQPREKISGQSEQLLGSGGKRVKSIWNTVLFQEFYDPNKKYDPAVLVQENLAHYILPKRKMKGRYRPEYLFPSFCNTAILIFLYYRTSYSKDRHIHDIANTVYWSRVFLENHFYTSYLFGFTCKEIVSNTDTVEIIIIGSHSPVNGIIIVVQGT